MANSTEVRDWDNVFDHRHDRRAHWEKGDFALSEYEKKSLREFNDAYDNFWKSRGKTPPVVSTRRLEVERWLTIKPNT